MNIDSSKIQQLIDYPGESLNVELKRWISPDTDEGQAKIVKAAIAFRNFNGGYLIIGFNGTDLTPDTTNVPADVRTEFHIDKIQGLISRYSSELFEVSVEFPKRNDQEYPVIVIPDGVTTPIAAKRNLPGDGRLIKTDDVYIRSLSSNGTPSTTKAKWNDWDKIVSICFDNREADIGRFLRRNLGALTPEMLQGLSPLLSTRAEPEPEIEEQLNQYLDESHGRLDQVLTDRQVELPPHGSWEIAFFINDGGISEQYPNEQFLNLILTNNPRYSGWPVWIDTRWHPEEAKRPYIMNDHWETFIKLQESGWSCGVDFLRLNPRGKFYLYRGLVDDFTTGERVPSPQTALEFVFPIINVMEAMAVGINFASAMGCDPENTKLSFVFRWSGLSNRELSTWAHPERGSLPEKRAHQNEVVAFQEVPLDTPISALGSYAYEVTQQLFRVFAGFEFQPSVVEDISQKFFDRSL